jgi:hypothetical protein
VEVKANATNQTLSVAQKRNMPETLPDQCDDGKTVCYRRVSPEGCFSDWNGKGDCPDRLPIDTCAKGPMKTTLSFSAQQHGLTAEDCAKELGCAVEDIVVKSPPVGGVAIESTQLLSAIADLLECFGTMEGTWYQDNWRSFGISEDMERVMCAAWESKYNATPNNISQG